MLVVSRSPPACPETSRDSGVGIAGITSISRDLTITCIYRLLVLIRIRAIHTVEDCMDADVRME